MKKHTFCIGLLVAAILVFVGCQFNEGVGSDSNGTTESNNRGSNGILDEGPRWDQAGIDHNRGMEYVDQWFVNNYDTAWTRDEIMDYAKVAILTFLADSMGYDSAKMRVHVDEVLKFEPTFGKDTNMLDLINDFKDSQLISPREEFYLRRMVEIIYVDDLDSTALTDSLKLLEDDMSVVSWDTTEVIGPSCCSVAIYSWEFRIKGIHFWPSDDPRPTYDWLGVLCCDAGGAAFGAAAGVSFGGVGAGPGAIGGACIGSGLKAWDDLCYFLFY